MSDDFDRMVQFMLVRKEHALMQNVVHAARMVIPVSESPECPLRQALLELEEFLNDPEREAIARMEARDEIARLLNVG